MPEPMPLRAVRVPTDLWERAQARATAEDTTVSEKVRTLLERWVDAVDAVHT